MSNLLDSASIVLTPTAYDNGRMLSVKPSVALGAELVTNGDFATDSDWALTQATISNGKLLLSTSDGSYTAASQTLGIIGKTYRVSLDVADIVGIISVTIGGGTDFDIASNGTHSFEITSTTTTLEVKRKFGVTNVSATIDNVSVKEDLSGDFDFSRNSAATRVNAQGLVENVQILSGNLVSNGDFSQEGVQEVSNGSFSQEGAELVTNGSFESGTTDWSAYYSGSLNNNGNALNVVSIGANDTRASTSIITEIGKTYRYECDIIQIQSTSTNLSVSNNINLDGNFAYGSIITTPTNSVSITFKATATTTYVGFKRSGNAADGITNIYDNVSVKEVGQDWSLGTGWSIGEDKVVHSGTVAGNLTQNVFTSGKSYKVKWTQTGGKFISVYADGLSSLISNSDVNKDYTVYFNSVSGGNISFRTNVDGAEVTNISVKEVGQDWNLGSGWSIGDDVAINDGTINAIYAQKAIQQGKKYVCKVDITFQGAGVAYWRLGNTTNLGVMSVDGTITQTLTGSANGNYIGIFANTSITITNISVIEITDDTNLPRINYEGFSYQDVLGSELVTNGGFDNGTNAWGITNASYEVLNGELKIYNQTSSPCNSFQTVSGLIVGKQYKVSFTSRLGGSGGNVARASFFGNIFASSSGQSATETIIITASSTTATISLFVYGTSLTEGYFDNISVKEYLGQEVVPDSGCGSWLLEPQSTNLATYSEDFSNASWQKIRATISSNDLISPEGILNANKFIEDNSADTHLMWSQTISISIGDKITWSVFAKKGERNWIYLRDVTAGNFTTWFDLENGTIGTETGSVESKIKDYGDGWYRCSITYTAITASARGRIYLAANNNQEPYQGDGTSGVYIWGAQIEQQSYATSYIPTNGATATRLQDIANNSGNATLINSTEGVLYAEMAALDAAGGKWIALSDGTTSERISIALNGSNARAYVRNTAGLIWDSSTPITDILEPSKIALRYKAGDYAMFLDGIKMSSSPDTSVASGISTLAFDSGAGASKFFGKNKALGVWKEALTDEQLYCLTYPAAVTPTFDLNFSTIADDFTFTRGSEATFVNSQGLIQSTNELGPELVTNGDFSNGSGWGLGTGWSIANGKLTANNAAGYALQSGVFESGVSKTYKINLSVSDYVSGYFTILTSGGTSQSQQFNANGDYTIYFNSNSPTATTLHFTHFGAFTGSIDNVSVKEVISATNTPRLDYSTGSEAFLLEPQSTNLIPYSEDFSSGGWTDNNVGTTPIITTGFLSPDGTNNATKISNQNKDSLVQWRSVTPVGGTKSIYAKTTGGNGQIFLLGGTNTPEALFDVTENWQRFTLNDPDLTHLYAVDFRGASTLSEVVVWGAQAEALSYATSYIPTSGAIATRNQELCVDATPVINSEEGVLYAEISALENDSINYKAISVSDGSITNRVQFSLRQNTIVAFISSGGVGQYSYAHTVPTTLNNHKVAFSYKANDFKFFVNGELINSSTSGITFPANILTKLAFNDGGSAKFFGNTEGLEYYPKALKDIQLIALTSWSSFTEMANALNYTIK